MKKLENTPKIRMKKSFQLAKGNDLETIEHLQRLDIQPFILAICACYDDIESQTGDFYDPTPKTRENTKALQDLTDALWEAGYSNRGTPYWVAKGGPSWDNVKTILNAAKNCEPALNNKYVSLQKQVKHDPTAQKQLKDFMDRYTAFSEATQKWEDKVALYEATVPRRSKEMDKMGAHDMCSMA